MKNQPKRLTSDQKHNLLRMGERAKFTLTKAARVLETNSDTLKNMIHREDCHFVEAVERAFPGAFNYPDEKEVMPGIRPIGYKDIGAIKVPATLHSLVATQIWDRTLEIRRGA